MKEPIEWFSEAVASGKYQQSIIEKMKTCISKDGFNVEDFMSWVSEKIEEESGGE